MNLGCFDQSGILNLKATVLSVITKSDFISSMSSMLLLYSLKKMKNSYPFGVQ
jgi:hypothetical protein